MRYKTLLCILGIFGIFITSRFVYATTSNTQSLLATSTTNPTGTFSSGIKILEGYSRMKGIIVINGNSTITPTAYINQAIDAASAVANTWHSTDTVSFTRSGTLWKGEIDVSIFGGYANLIVGNFSTATFNKINWYASLETSVSTTVNTSVVGTVTTAVPTVTAVTHNILIVGTTSTILLGTNTTTRHYVLLANEGGTNTCRVMLASAATVGSGTILYVSGGSYEPDFKNAIYTGAICAITSGGTTAVSVIEY